MAKETKPAQMINAVDKRTRDLIFKTKQKLEGIRAEAQAKIEIAKIDPTMYEKEVVDKFKILYFETSKSIESVNTLFETDVASDLDIEQYRKENGPQLAEFADQLELFVNQASEVLSKL